MLLVVGLGNPSFEYHDTRHNFGFLVVDQLAAMFKIKDDEIKHVFGIEANWFCVETENKTITVAKPTVYMNESGRSVKSLLKKFSLATANLVVIHDDLDLELGQIKIKEGSSSGGHLGVESIIRSTGSRDFIRLRLGIGRPPGRKEPADFVLEPFKKKEQEEVEFVCNRATEAVIDLAKFGLEKVMNKYN